MQCVIRTKPFSELILRIKNSINTEFVNGIKETIQEYMKHTATVSTIHELLGEADTIFTVGVQGDSFFVLNKIFCLINDEVKNMNVEDPTNVFKFKQINRCKLL